MLSRLLLVPALIVILLGASCTMMPYAREVKKRPQEGGVIALPTHYRPEDRAKADSLMELNCAEKAPKVREEGEVVVGERTNSSVARDTDYYSTNNSNAQWGTVHFGPTTNTNAYSETTQVKEWQISYECVARDMTPVAPVAQKTKKKSGRG